MVGINWVQTTIAYYYIFIILFNMTNFKAIRQNISSTFSNDKVKQIFEDHIKMLVLYLTNNCRRDGHALLLEILLYVHTNALVVYFDQTLYNIKRIFDICIASLRVCVLNYKDLTNKILQSDVTLTYSVRSRVTRLNINLFSGISRYYRGYL